MADDGQRPRTATQDYATQPGTPSETSHTRHSSASAHSTGFNTPQPLTAQPAQERSYSSMASDPNRRRPRPLDSAASNYGSIQGSVTGREQTLSPQPTRAGPKKPGMGKRTVSASAPLRGRHFSIDDDQREVEEDLKLARTQSGRQLLRTKTSTLRRRPTAQPPGLPRVESEEAEDAEDAVFAEASGSQTLHKPGESLSKPDDPDSINPSSGTDETLHGEDEAVTPPAVDDDEGDDDEGLDDEGLDSDEDDDADLSDAESFTLKDRQEAINETHPFGIRIWKPALYRKNRSVQQNAESDIHSTPGGAVSRWLFCFNFLWTAIFGWWLALVAFIGSLTCSMFALVGAPGCMDYGNVLWSLGKYLFYPFGKYVKLEHDEAYLDEDEGEGRSISEYERWQTGDLEEGRLFFGPTDINRSIIGRRRDSLDDAEETDSLLGRARRGERDTRRATGKKRLFGRGQWNVGRVIFFMFFYFLISPLLFLASGICWFLVFTIPMGKVTLLLFYHLRRHPLALSFHADSHYSRAPGAPGSSILLCTYRAVGLKYWKYTIDGTNIFLINLLGLVFFAIFDYFCLKVALGLHIFITSSGFVFVLALASIIPLAYFIGQAVASISAQSSMGVGATINAFFSTIVEVFLYCVALNQGKAQLVEGSIIGSIFAGILFLPGISMCFGALKRKTQRFNVRSAGVTSTMLLFAVIGAFGPTLFYQIYGSHELNCFSCTEVDPASPDRDCRRCFFTQIPALHDRFYLEAVRPYIWSAAVMLFASYVIGLLFTLRTHAAVIWNNELDEKKVEKMEHAALRIEQRSGANSGGGGADRRTSVANNTAKDPRVEWNRQATSGSINTLPRESIKDSQLYKRILNQSLKQVGIHTTSPSDQPNTQQKPQPDAQTPHLVPPKPVDTAEDATSVRIHGLSAVDSRALVQQIAEMASTAATVAARDATKAPAKAQRMASTSAPIPPYSAGERAASLRQPHSVSSKDSPVPRPEVHRASVLEPNNLGFEAEETTGAAAAEGGGHDAPNWSRMKSAIVLLTATLAYAIIAEILVDTVDSVLAHVDVDEKFLGITLFALVPNTTEFLNAISFAMNGNIALSMEIGSAYALQVLLLQIPALVLYSGVYGMYIDAADVGEHTFVMIFPQWDLVTVILGVVLVGYVLGEGKSNYFKGSMLMLSYAVVIIGFWFSGYNNIETMGADRFDTRASGGGYESFKTIGRGTSGRAY